MSATKVSSQSVAPKYVNAFVGTAWHGELGGVLTVFVCQVPIAHCMSEMPSHHGIPWFFDEAYETQATVALAAFKYLLQHQLEAYYDFGSPVRCNVPLWDEKVREHLPELLDRAYSLESDMALRNPR
jgi:hypothetical protein